MTQEILMDSKGRILVPLEIRKQLNLKTGEKFMFSIENGHLILLKSSTYEEFINEIADFQENVQKASKAPISTEKLF